MANSANALKGEGLTVAIGDGADPEVFTNIGEVLSTAIAQTRDTIEVTTLDEAWKEYIAGLKDGGEVPVELNYYPDDTGQTTIQTDFENGTLRNFKITLTNSGSSEVTFAAIISALGWNSSTGEKITGSVSLKVSGAITFTA